MAHTFLKLTRTFGQWTELTDGRTGLIAQVRAVRCAEDSNKVQMEFKAPPEVRIERIKGPDAGGQRA